MVVLGDARVVEGRASATVSSVEEVPAGRDPNDRRRTSRGSVATLDLTRGRIDWHVPASPGAFDGHVRAHAADTGRVLWDYDTAPAHDTVNAGMVEGGTIDMGGATLVDGTLYVNSGYGLWDRMGRLLIAFSVDGR